MKHRNITITTTNQSKQTRKYTTDELPGSIIIQLHGLSSFSWHRFEDNLGETAERRGGARMGFSERYDAILSRN